MGSYPHFIVVTDPAKRTALAGFYKRAWDAYLPLRFSASNLHFEDPIHEAQQPRVSRSLAWAADVGGAEWRAAVGPGRWPLAWPVRSLHQAGAALAFSSDWNVAEMDPVTGIYTALIRQDLAGGDPFVPEQAIDLAAAISAYTIGGAYANFCEDHRGSLAPGKAADLIALSDNLFQLPPGRIKDCRVELTMVAGQIHHQQW